jgi:site-specific DNA-methyltransferase (adenine-specific)
MTLRAPYLDDGDVRLYVGDCVEVMREMEAESVDAVVCDPPYGLEFMGKDWDAPWKAAGKVERAREGTDVSHPFRDGAPRVEYGFGGRASYDFAAWCETWAREAMRVLKPGGHLLAFGGTRTFHRLTCGIEDAGFEVRDCLSWLYGSGFPKSLDVSKAIDKAAGAEREVVGQGANASRRPRAGKGATIHMPAGDPITAPATDAAREWQGWGTALKPAWEPCVVARKPLIGTVAANVQQHGTGALNIDGCRIDYASDADRPTQEEWNRMGSSGAAGANGFAGQFSQGMKDAYADGKIPVPSGRWPANVAFDEAAAAMLDAQSGERPSGIAVQRNGGGGKIWGSANRRGDTPDAGYSDTGGASRFFYTAKASRADRNAGGMAENTHPTVKPTDLMRWLVRLVTPPGGIVLDPFAGSGSTLVAARAEGVRAVGIEREDEYARIIADRLAQLSLFTEGME